MPKCMLDYAWVEEKRQMSVNLFYTFAYRLTWTYFERTGLPAEVKDGERCTSYLSIIVHHVHISRGGGGKGRKTSEMLEDSFPPIEAWKGRKKSTELHWFNTESRWAYKGVVTHCLFKDLDCQKDGACEGLALNSASSTASHLIGTHFAIFRFEDNTCNKVGFLDPHKRGQKIRSIF